MFFRFAHFVCLDLGPCFTVVLKIILVISIIQQLQIFLEGKIN